MKIHPHHDIIIAYLEGHPIEFRTETCDDWVPLTSLVECGGNLPKFHVQWDYRVVVKEKPPKVYYRQVLPDGSVTTAIDPTRPTLVLTLNGNTGQLEKAEIRQ